MKFLVAAWYEFLKNIRDIKMVGALIIFPILTIYVVGTAVEGFFDASSDTRYEIAYVNEDQGAVGEQFDTFLAQDDLQERLVVHPYATEAEGRRAVDEDGLAALVYLPEGLSESVMNGEPGAISVYGNGSQALVETLVSGYTSAFNAMYAVISTGGIPAEVSRQGHIQRAARIRSIPDLKDYYAVVILLQILVMGGIFGVHMTTKKYGSDIHIRMHALPVRQWVTLAGRILGSAVYLFLASVVIILVSGWAFSANWDGNAWIMGSTLLLFCLCMVCLGAAIGRIFGKFSTSLMMVITLMFFFGVATGSSSPQSRLVALGKFTPNYYAKTLLFGTIYGYPAETMVQSALMLAGIAIAIFAILGLLMRRTANDNI